jgi:hypothetical protein
MIWTLVAQLGSLKGKPGSEALGNVVCGTENRGAMLNAFRTLNH